MGFFGASVGRFARELKGLSSSTKVISQFNQKFLLATCNVTESDVLVELISPKRHCRDKTKIAFCTKIDILFF
jgi:hypothetical protein